MLQTSILDLLKKAKAKRNLIVRDETNKARDLTICRSEIPTLCLVQQYI